MTTEHQTAPAVGLVSGLAGLVSRKTRIGIHSLVSLANLFPNGSHRRYSATDETPTKMNPEIADKIKIEMGRLSNLLSNVSLAQIEAVNMAVHGRNCSYGGMASLRPIDIVVRQDEIGFFRAYISEQIERVALPGAWVTLKQRGPIGLKLHGMSEAAHDRRLVAVLGVLQELTALLKEHGAEDRGPDSADQAFAAAYGSLSYL